MLKEGWIKKDSREAVKALDDLIGFVFEMMFEDYPHTKTQVCKVIDQSKYQWDDLKKIMEE